MLVYYKKMKEYIVYPSLPKYIQTLTWIIKCQHSCDRVDI